MEMQKWILIDGKISVAFLDVNIGAIVAEIFSGSRSGHLKAITRLQLPSVGFGRPRLVDGSEV